MHEQGARGFLDPERLCRAAEQFDRVMKEYSEAAAACEQAASQASSAVGLRFYTDNKTAVAERYATEERMQELFGGPPRNRHERRKWAKLQRGRR